MPQLLFQERSISSNRTPPAEDMAFCDRLLSAPVSGGFRMDGYYVWCGSVIRGEEGLYHMFASRWPQGMAFSPHWVTNSEIVRATAVSPNGPYEFQEVVLAPRGEEFWDGRMTHNPTIHRAPDGTYLLFYTGTTYHGPAPSPANPEDGWTPFVRRAHKNQRIGLATAPSPGGPWTRREQPIIGPRPGRWDGLITTNPAVCVCPDGRILLIYKSIEYLGDLLRLGVARAENYASPFVRLQDEPILRFDATGDHVEDPYLWNSPDGGFEMIMKDMRGGLGGEARGGLHARSDDGIHWRLSQPSQAYSRTVLWDDGHSSTQDFLERPQLLIEEGRPTHLFVATSLGGTSAETQTCSWNMVIPLRAP